LGYAMRLAYLGEKQGTKAPPVFKAWISDRDLLQQNIPTTEVQVLLTKSELSDLSDVMKKIVNAANEGLISPDNMFADLRSIAATMGNDPNQIKQGSATKLGEMGLLGEYVENLPYLSEVLGLDEETWKSWDGLEQEKFIRRLNTKLQYYQR
ncbi:serine/threonine protein kinase, partial [Escherichia coli]|nr:serine/threonine protein kinase [Escherichia coli]